MVTMTYYITTFPEQNFLNKASLELDNDILKRRLSPLFDVFTQDVKTTRKGKILEKLVDSIHIIKSSYWSEDKDYKIPGFVTSCDIGINTYPAKTKYGFIEVAEPYFDEKGHLEREFLLGLGDIGFPFLSILKHFKIAADAVAAFYLENKFAGYGLPTREDYRTFWIAKHFIPSEFQMKKTREASYRLGNLAREKEEEGTGLQFIYEQTRR